MADLNYIRRHKCPSCGAEVVFNDKTLTAAHKAPECEWFLKAATQMGGTPGKLVLLDDNGLEQKGGC